MIAAIDKNDAEDNLAQVFVVAGREEWMVDVRPEARWRTRIEQVGL